MGTAYEFLFGLSLGVASGLVPGMHPNMVISVLSGLGMRGDALASLIIALYPASLIASFIPSIFFGVPDEGTLAVVLPGQRMVREGRGIAALKAVLFSAAAAALFSLALVQPMLLALPAAYGLIKGRMGWVLLAMAALMVFRRRKPLPALALFALSGALGQATFSMGMEDPFLPLFSGMFAIASMAAYRKGSVPEQEDGEAHGGARPGCVAAGVGLGALAVLVPGVGSPAQMASLLTAFVRLDTMSYLSAASAISVSQAILGLAASASIGKERVGAIAWLASCTDIGSALPMLSALAAASFALSAGAVYLLRKRAAALASLDFSGLNAILGAYLACVCFIVDGPLGLAGLAASSALGYLAIRSGAERTMLMGSIIVPTLLLLFHLSS